MAPRPRPAGPDVTEIQNESDAGSNVSAILSDTGSESEASDDSEFDSGDSDDDDDLRDNSFYDEGQLAPGHYLAQARNLDVSQLRQKRYADTTDNKLDDVRWDWGRWTALLTPCDPLGANR